MHKKIIGWLSTVRILWKFAITQWNLNWNKFFKLTPKDLIALERFLSKCFWIYHVNYLTPNLPLNNHILPANFNTYLQRVFLQRLCLQLMLEKLGWYQKVRLQICYENKIHYVKYESCFSEEMCLKTTCTAKNIKFYLTMKFWELFIVKDIHYYYYYFHFLTFFLMPSPFFT